MRIFLVLSLLLVACAGPSRPSTPPPSPSPSPLTPTEVVVVETATADLPTAEPSETPALSPTSTGTATAIPGPTSTPTLPASGQAEPERVAVSGGGNQFVNMRREPGTDAPVVRSIRDGTEVVIVGPDRQSDGRIWRNVQDGADTGWIVSTALRALPTPPPTPSSTPTSPATATPLPSATTAAQATATSTPAELTATPTATEQAEPEPVDVSGAGSGGANVRAEPGTSSRIVQTVLDGTRLTVVGPDREVDGRVWRNIRTESGTTGWIVSEVVQSLVTPSPTATSTVAATPSSTPTPPATASVSASGTPPATATSTPGPDDAEPEEEPTPEPERVEVYGTAPQGANLRAQPSRSGSVLRSVPDGSTLTIVGEDQTVDGVVWRNVQAEDGVVGWLAVEVVKSIVTPTPTPRLGAPGIGAPILEEPEPEELQTDEERAAVPCRPGQVKGDATTGIFYPVDRPEYSALRERVRCFDDVTRARASGFRPPETLEPLPSPSPDPGGE